MGWRWGDSEAVRGLHPGHRQGNSKKGGGGLKDISAALYHNASVIVSQWRPLIHFFQSSFSSGVRAPWMSSTRIGPAMAARSSFRRRERAFNVYRSSYPLSYRGKDWSEGQDCTCKKGAEWNLVSATLGHFHAALEGFEVISNLGSWEALPDDFFKGLPLQRNEVGAGQSADHDDVGKDG